MNGTDARPRATTWRAVLGAATALVLAFATPASANGSPNGLDDVRTYCSGCHLEEKPGEFRRISHQRKTPEGWLMTIVRMQHAHGLSIPDETRTSLVQHLADTQGLAPAEAAAGRYALERRPNARDPKMESDLNVMCGRCHSLGRVLLQRRDADEWLKLVHFHVGQFPTLEYQAGSRDRFWWQIATGELPAKLGAQFAFDTVEWRDWRRQAPADLSGDWIIYGRAPGRGAYAGTMRVSASEGSERIAESELQFEGEAAPERRRSKVRIYTGYEWRGSADASGRPLREVFEASADGRRLSGRWFEADHAEIGGEFRAERATGEPAVFAVFPHALRSGRTQEAVVVGRGLSGDVSFGPGTRTKVLGRQPGIVRVSVTVAPGAAVGARTVTVGRTAAPNQAVVYDRIVRVEVQPTHAIARVGGGRVAPTFAQFDALGFAAPASPNEAPLPLGPIDVEWSVEPYNQVAVEWEDLKYAGTLERTGRFVPAASGPNPARRFSANNTGELRIVARPAGDGGDVRGDSRLIVTVQRWVDTPLN